MFFPMGFSLEVSKGKISEPKIPSSQAAAAAAAAASAAWFHILNYSARRRPRRAQPTQLS